MLALTDLVKAANVYLSKRQDATGAPLPRQAPAPARLSRVAVCMPREPSVAHQGLTRSFWAPADGTAFSSPKPLCLRPPPSPAP